VQILDSLQSRINYVRVMLFRATTQDEHRITIGLLRLVTQSVADGETNAAVDTYCRYLKRAEDRATGIIEGRKASRLDIRATKTDRKKG
jgi:GntR family transcriptional regulator, trigonelline degradation regulator